MLVRKLNVCFIKYQSVCEHSCINYGILGETIDVQKWFIFTILLIDVQKQFIFCHIVLTAGHEAVLIFGMSRSNSTWRL